MSTDPFYQIKNYSDIQRLYPYLEELMRSNPATLRDLKGKAEGQVEKTRYQGVGGSPNVVIDPKYMTGPTLGHEYAHVATDVSPNWSYIIDPKMERQNIPKKVGEGYPLGYDWNQGLGFKGAYPTDRWVEEGMVRTVTPQGEVAGAINKHPEIYFTETQQALLPKWRQFLQYGPTVGSFWGDTEEKKGIDIYPRITKFENPEHEKTFQTWLRGIEKQTGRKYDPDKDTTYDYRMAFKTGAKPEYVEEHKQWRWPDVSPNRILLKSTDYDAKIDHETGKPKEEVTRGIYNKNSENEEENSRTRPLTWSEMTYYP